MAIAVSMISESQDHYIFAFNDGTPVEEVMQQVSQCPDFSHMYHVDVAITNDEDVDYKQLESDIFEMSQKERYGDDD